MSSVAMKWAKRQKIEDRTITVVLAAFAARANDDGTAEVSQTSVANQLKLNERTVRRLLLAMEHLGVLSRNKHVGIQGRGRLPDIVTLHTGRDFHITKETILAAKRLGPTGQDVLTNSWDQPDKMPDGPKSENEAPPYIVRARGVVSPASPPNLHLNVRVSSRVRFDRGRNSWRALLTVDDVTMELGRFDTEASARQFADEAVSDVYRTTIARVGTPRNPVVKPELTALAGLDLASFLFGDSHEQEETDETEPSAVPVQQPHPDPSCNGAGVGSASGQGTKFLAGVGGAHEPSQQDAAHACANVLPFSGRAA